MKVPPLADPVRLDKYLIQIYPFTSRQYWRDHLQERVKVDGRAPKKGLQLRGGEDLLVDPVPTPEPPPLTPNPDLKIPILFEDEHLFAVDKPAGLPCLPARAGDTQNLLSAVAAQFPEQQDMLSQSQEGGLTHRLDNGTSGILLWAKTPELKKQLRDMHGAGKIQKEYQAWVHGSLPGRGLIKDPIAHAPKNSAKMVVVPEDKMKKLKGRPAQTQYECLKDTQDFTLLRLGLSKGVRHQIRVHLAHLGHPIVGDQLYGSESAFPEGVHLLHAHGLAFTHPLTGKKFLLQAPLPDHFHPKNKPTANH